MSFLHFHLLTDAKIAARKANGHVLATAAGSGLAKAVTSAAQTGNPIGAATLAAITAAESTGKTGAEKRADVIAAVAPVIVAEAAKGSVSVVVADAEAFAALVLEEVVGSLKRTTVVTIGEATLHRLGLA